MRETNGPLTFARILMRATIYAYKQPPKCQVGNNGFPIYSPYSCSDDAGDFVNHRTLFKVSGSVVMTNYSYKI